MNFEELYVYGLLLRVGLVTMSEYGKWLDKIYLSSDDESIVFELEDCSGDLNKTASLIDSIALSKDIDFSIVGKLLFLKLEELYYDSSIDFRKLSKYANSIWEMLPLDIANEKPFYMLFYIYDILRDDEVVRARSLFLELFDYYR